MAKGAVIAMLLSALVLLAFASQVEAQCKAVDTNSLRVCLTSIANKRCEANCKSALQPYASQSPQCICQLVNQAVNLGAAFGVTKSDINTLIVNCGQAAPNCR